MASSGEDGRLHQAGGLIGVGSARCVGVEGNVKKIKARLPGASPLKSRLGRRGREREVGGGKGENSFPENRGVGKWRVTSAEQSSRTHVPEGLSHGWYQSAQSSPGELGKTGPRAESLQERGKHIPDNSSTSEKENARGWGQSAGDGECAGWGTAVHVGACAVLF